MKIDLGMTSISVNGRMKHLRTLVKRALNRGWIRQDPFYGYVREKVVSRRRWLSRDEPERMMQVKMENETLNFTKDIFVFSCFTGTCYADLKNLKHSDICEQEDRSFCIFLKRQKTGTDACIPLLPVALAILEKHKDSQFAGWGGNVFRMQTLNSVDKHLKTIAQAARIEQRLTFHMGRHTFATTTCLTNGVPVESVSRMLGHRSIYTTQI
jgi:site-specific recombinase XerD